jgi:hypothetical protein
MADSIMYHDGNAPCRIGSTAGAFPTGLRRADAHCVYRRRQGVHRKRDLFLLSTADADGRRTVRSRADRQASCA